MDGTPGGAAAELELDLARRQRGIDGWPMRVDRRLFIVNSSYGAPIGGSLADISRAILIFLESLHASFASIDSFSDSFLMAGDFGDVVGDRGTLFRPTILTETNALEYGIPNLAHGSLDLPRDELALDNILWLLDHGEFNRIPS
jgi:hypothetical protein